MGKMNQLSATIDEMIACGNGLVKATEALNAFYSPENEPAQEGRPTETRLRYSLRNVMSCPANGQLMTLGR